MSFKEPPGQVARWLGRLQYDSEIQRHPGRLHNNGDALSRRPTRQHGNCPSFTPTGLSQVTVVARDLPVGETPREVRNCWYPEVVAQAQRDDPDISVRVLYIKSAAHTTQAKLGMVAPKQLVEQALVEVHDGVACAHLGGMESLMKMKARFRRPERTFSETCQLLSINKTLSSAYHPKGNGQVENLHKNLRSMLKARVEDNPATWDEHLDFCLMAYRSSVHSSTGHNPFELMFGRKMTTPLDVMVGGAEDNECSYTDFDAVELHKFHNT
ncbi:uncharacterized protein [Pocillopora verrucosa]|uniref:uncharacterized protein n=1 Tax=Pocillopora verrucosa TaxID=203993 RepID=UPI00334259C6